MEKSDKFIKKEEVDEKNIAIVGQSRLGKTALVTGMLDERFTFSLSK